MKKYLPNIVSCIRIVGALILVVFFKEFSPAFLIIYGISAATDAVDGYLARRFDVCSVLGVALDTIGDGLIGFAPIKVLLIQKAIEPWIFAWLLVSAGFFFTAAVISLVKFRKFSFPHTYFDKFLGVFVFSSPYLYQVVDVTALLTAVATVFFIASVESVIIEIRLKEAKSFVPSVFHTDK